MDRSSSRIGRHHKSHAHAEGIRQPAGARGSEWPPSIELGARGKGHEDPPPERIESSKVGVVANLAPHAERGRRSQRRKPSEQPLNWANIPSRTNSSDYFYSYQSTGASPFQLLLFRPCSTLHLNSDVPWCHQWILCHVPMSSQEQTNPSNGRHTWNLEIKGC